MVIPQHLLLQSKHPSPFPSLSLYKARHSTPVSQLIQFQHQLQHGHVKKDSGEYEVDPEKAKDALKKLDQQLQALSTKQVSTPKIRASDVKLTRDEIVEVEPELSGSFLPYLTIALLTFTIFYNVLFYSVIKPSIDGPNSPPQLSSSQTEPRGASVLQ